MLNKRMNQLIEYGLSTGLLKEDDRFYALNRLSQVFKQDFVSEIYPLDIEYDQLMDEILREADQLSLLDHMSVVDRDAFEARIMDCLMARPTEINQTFRRFYKKSPQQASQFLYDYSRHSNHIKSKRNALNIKYSVPSQYGYLDILLNMAKPDYSQFKDELDNIHPISNLYLENVGKHLSNNLLPMSTLRVANITVDNEKNQWGLFYKAYGLIEEHCMVIKKDHQALQVNKKTFSELIDFVNKFPQYTVGVDADLNFSGGSHLSHHHFQAGKYSFPIEKANAKAFYKKNRVKIEILDWPMAAIKLSANNENKILDKMEDIYKVWKDYTKQDIQLFSKTDEIQHNSFSIMVKLDGSDFSVYMILRNNYKNDKFPMGLYHIDPSNFHIKKDNLALFDVLGLGILPGTLYEEVNIIKDILLEKETINNYPNLSKHQEWINELQRKVKKDKIDDFLKEEIGQVYVKMLEDANVFKFGSHEDFISMIEKAI